MTLNSLRPGRPCAVCQRGRIERVNNTLKPDVIDTAYVSNPYNLSLVIIVIMFVAFVVLHVV